MNAGHFKFKINTKENHFEPAHVHVWVGNEDVCRIELSGGLFMDPPPPGEHHRILEIYDKHIDEIRAAWDKYHAR